MHIHTYTHTHISIHINIHRHARIHAHMLYLKQIRCSIFLLISIIPILLSIFEIVGHHYDDIVVVVVVVVMMIMMMIVVEDDNDDDGGDGDVTIHRRRCYLKETPSSGLLVDGPLHEITRWTYHVQAHQPRSVRCY